MKLSTDKLYYNFFRRIQRLQICKIPADVIGTLTITNYTIFFESNDTGRFVDET